MNSGCLGFSRLLAQAGNMRIHGPGRFIHRNHFTTIVADLAEFGRAAFDMPMNPEYFEPPGPGTPVKIGGGSRVSEVGD